MRVYVRECMYASVDMRVRMRGRPYTCSVHCAEIQYLYSFTIELRYVVDGQYRPPTNITVVIDYYTFRIFFLFFSVISICL